MKILGENHMSLSQIGAQISPFRAETSKSIFRKSAAWVFVFSTAKSIYYHGLSTQFFSKWSLDPCQPTRVFAWLASNFNFKFTIGDAQIFKVKLIVKGLSWFSTTFKWNYADWHIMGGYPARMRFMKFKILAIFKSTHSPFFSSAVYS